MTPAIYGSLHTVFGNTIYIQANGHWFNDPKDSTSIPSGLINHPIFDKKNHGIWMSGTPSFIFFDITTEKFYHCRNNPKDIKLLNDKIEATLTVLDTNNNIWFLESKNHQNIYYYSYDNNSIHSVPLNRTRGPFDLNLDNKNKIWIHFWHGRSFIYDPSTRSLDSIFLDNFHSQSAISNNANNIFIDNQNNYWITTLSGISIYNPMAQAVKYFIINDNRITDDGRELLITNITEQNDSILWLGTAQGLYRYNQTQRRGKFITNFPLLPDNNNQSIRTLCFQNDSILCVAAWTSFFRYNIHSKKIVGGINKIQFPQSIITDLQGNIWVATWLNGLYEFSSHGKLLKHLLHDSDSGETVFSNNLVCFGKAD